MSTHNTREWIEGNISFKAIAKQSVDGTCRKGDWVCGNLISNNGRPFIVGDVVESDEEYILFEFWVPVEKESITSLVPEQTHHRELQKARVEMLHKLHLCAIGKYQGDALENVKAQIKEYQAEL
jgi:hypothetical protein